MISSDVLTVCCDAVLEAPERGASSQLASSTAHAQLPRGQSAQARGARSGSSRCTYLDLDAGCWSGAHTALQDDRGESEGRSAGRWERCVGQTASAQSDGREKRDRATTQPVR